MPTATKLSKMVTYYESLLPIVARPFGHVAF